MSASKVTFAYLLPQSYPTLSIGKTTASVTFDVSGDTSISGNLNVDSGLIFTNASTNRVGIGKTNPTVLFDVSGDTTITGNLNVDSGLIFTDASINRVGIGKTNPTVLFDVSGNTSISGTLTVDTNTLFVDTINKRIGIRKTNPGTVLDVSGNGAIAGNLTVGMLPILNVDSSNNRIGIGVVNPTRTLDISGSTRISAALDVSGATAISGNLVVNTNNLFVDAANGRVGIGMNNPSRALEVTGAARITSTLDVSGATAITGNLTVKTNVLAVDASNNRVGIGKSDPSVALDVSGNINLTGNLLRNSSYFTQNFLYNSNITRSGGTAGSAGSITITFPESLSMSQTLKIMIFGSINTGAVDSIDNSIYISRFNGSNTFTTNATSSVVLSTSTVTNVANIVTGTSGYGVESICECTLGYTSTNSIILQAYLSRRNTSTNQISQTNIMAYCTGTAIGSSLQSIELSSQYGYNVQCKIFKI